MMSKIRVAFAVLLFVGMVGWAIFAAVKDRFFPETSPKLTAFHVKDDGSVSVTVMNSGGEGDAVIWIHGSDGSGINADTSSKAWKTRVHLPAKRAMTFVLTPKIEGNPATLLCDVHVPWPEDR